MGGLKDFKEIPTKIKFDEKKAEPFNEYLIKIRDSGYSGRVRTILKITQNAIKEACSTLTNYERHPDGEYEAKVTKAKLERASKLLKRLETREKVDSLLASNLKFYENMKGITF